MYVSQGLCVSNEWNFEATSGLRCPQRSAGQHATLMHSMSLVPEFGGQSARCIVKLKMFGCIRFHGLVYETALNTCWPRCKSIEIKLYMQIKRNRRQKMERTRTKERIKKGEMEAIHGRDEKHREQKTNGQDKWSITLLCSRDRHLLPIHANSSRIMPRTMVDNMKGSCARNFCPNMTPKC